MELNSENKPLSYYLRHKLNPDCLSEVLKYLSAPDLLRVCGLDTSDDQFFTNIINERIIDKMWFYFARYNRQINSYHDQFFKLFGRFMKKIIIRVMHMKYIMPTIMKFCSPDTLKELKIKVEVSDLHVVPDDLVSRDILKQAIPYIRGVHRIFIDIHDHILCELNPHLQKVLAYFIIEARELQALKVVNLRMGHFLNLVKNMKSKLCEIHLTDVIMMKNDLVRLIHKMPKLEKLISNTINIASIGKELTKHCPKLQNFVINVGYDETVDYNFLNSFQHLTEVTLISQPRGKQNFLNILQILATKNTLHTLKITLHAKVNFSINELEGCCQNLVGFLNLKIVKFNLRHEFDHQKRKEFFQSIITPMKSLEKIEVYGIKRSNLIVPAFVTEVLAQKW